jgi:hypothetical protein
MRHMSNSEKPQSPELKARRDPPTLKTVSVADIADTGELLIDRVESRGIDTSVSPQLSAGDVDARWDQAESGGEETPGGSSSTPGQDVVDEIGRAIGVTYQEGEPLRVGRKEEERDEHRWELDPASAEDYGERSGPALSESVPVRRMKHHDQYGKTPRP